MKTAIKERVVSAMNRLLERDAYLLKKAVNEQSVTQRLAVYLEDEFRDEFPESNVDCEYDKNAEHATGRKYIAGVGDAKPDIIVHRRGANYPTNLLAIEAKKHDAPDAEHRDYWKLKGLLNPQGEYRFKVVAFLRLWTRDPIGATLVFGDDDVRHFRGGQNADPWPWFATPRPEVPPPGRRGRPPRVR